MKRDFKNRNPFVDLPYDPALPGLAAMFNTDMIKSSLSDRFTNAGAPINKCEVVYIRYKPGTNCIIVYEIALERETGYGITCLPAFAKLYADDEFKYTVDKATHHRWTNLGGLGDFMLFEEHKAIFYFFPNDPIIDGLRMLANPKKIQRMLYQHCSGYPEDSWRISDRRLRVSIVRFKPERRAVIRLDTRAINRTDGTKVTMSVYARIYADMSGERAFNTQRRLYRISKNTEGPGIPDPIAYLPERRVFLMESLRGTTLQEYINNGDFSALEVAAQSLASLHRFAPGNILAADTQPSEAKLDDTRQMISSIAPELSSPAGAICESLTNRLFTAREFDPGFVHGDLHPGQIIIDGDKTSIIDFDRSYLGDTVADIGNFIANIKLWGVLENENTVSIEDPFVSAYNEAADIKPDKERLSFWTAYSLFQLAVSPFRSLKPNWRDKISQILAICRSLLP